MLILEIRYSPLYRLRLFIQIIPLINNKQKLNKYWNKKRNVNNKRLLENLYKSLTQKEIVDS